MAEMISDFKPYVNLSNAIIKSVAKEYKKALKRLVADPDDGEAIHTKEEAECFFLSEWYQFLTNVHPNYLMKRIQKEVGYHDRYN